MVDTTHLELPFLAASQAQKHVTHNDALLRLDALVALAVLDRDLAAPPGAPSEGDRYIVAAGATGAWSGHDGKVVAFQDGVWAVFAPRAGWRAWVADEGRILTHNGTNWLDAIAASASEATIDFHVVEEEITVASGAFVDSGVQIPDRAIVFGVSTRTTEAVTGATSYDCGIAGEVAKFGATLGVGAGSTNSGVIGPTAFYAATSVRLTANGADFTGGKVRIAIHYMLCGVPAS
jgi:hypothetical protein